MRRALVIDENRFGENHPNVARHLNNLAQLLKDTNRLKEAEPMFQRAVAIANNSWGKEHPNTKTVEKNYSLFKKQKPPPKDSEYHNSISPNTPGKSKSLLQPPSPATTSTLQQHPLPIHPPHLHSSSPIQFPKSDT
jgi:hypothetical protein